MINVSNQFKKDAQIRQDFYVTASCTLSDGSQLSLGKEDFYISGNGYVDSSDSSDFPIGAAIEKTATLCLVNDDDRFSEYNFNAARFILFLNFDLSTGTAEKVRLGTYIVNKKPATATKISLTLTDRMHDADRPYSTGRSFPMTAFEMLQDSCETCGIQLGDARIQNGDFIVNEAPHGTTHRAVIGDIAMIAGGNARIDETDKLRIITFNKSVFNDAYDGGTFEPWTKGEDLDGGTFEPWTEGELADGGTFADMDSYHVLYRIRDLEVDTDDVEVTGAKVVVDDKTSYAYGEEGYVVAVENMLIAGNEQDAVQRIGEAVIGLKMRPFSCQHTAYPLATFLDPVYVEDEKGRVYKSYLTNVEFAFNGYTALSNTAKSADEQMSEFYSPSAVAVEQAKKNMDKKMSAYDVAVQNMNDLAANTLGLYPTRVIGEDGSEIMYWHDKPTLKESKTVYKRGAEGFFVTQNYAGDDAATKWTSGFDASGNAVLNILQVIGFYFDWARGGTLTLGGNANGNGVLTVLTEKGAEAARLDNSGLLLRYADINIVGTKKYTVGNSLMPYTASIVDGFLTCGYPKFHYGVSIDAPSYDKDYNILKLEAGTQLYIGGYYSDESPRTIVIHAGSSNSEKVTGEITLSAKNVWLGGSSSSVYVQNQFHAYQIGCTYKITADELEISGSKKRIVNTNDYEARSLYCYEMPSPMFGDIGEAITDEKGECYIYLDDIFSETVSTQIEYQVFLQKEGRGDIWVEKKAPQYFSVKGTENLKFSWEIKAKQRDYEFNRLEALNPLSRDDVESFDFEKLYEKEINDILKRREEIIYETT